MGEGFFATSLGKVIGLARKNSIWPLPFATSCCGIEFMATMGSHYDLARFGSERVGFSPRQCDLLMVMGTIAKKPSPIDPSGISAMLISFSKAFSCMLYDTGRSIKFQILDLRFQIYNTSET